MYIQTYINTDTYTNTYIYTYTHKQIHTYIYTYTHRWNIVQNKFYKNTIVWFKISEVFHKKHLLQFQKWIYFILSNH